MHTLDCELLVNVLFLQVRQDWYGRPPAGVYVPTPHCLHGAALAMGENIPALQAVQALAELVLLVLP
jgi:hypothetical protein